MDETAPSNHPRVARADGLRAIAALWVFLYHLYRSEHLAALHAALPRPLAIWLLERGDLGVIIFFVLSGYVMALQVGERRVTGESMGRLLVRRVIRLTPPYYASILVAMVMLYVLWCRGGTTTNWPTLAALGAHFFYAQRLFVSPTLNAVFWTLIVELQFYAVFALLMLGATSWRFGGAHARSILFALTGLVSLFLRLDEGSGARAPDFALFWFCFAGGALGFWAQRLGGLSVWLHRACLALLLVGAAIGPSEAGYLLVAALTIISLTEQRLPGNFWVWLTARPLLRFGMISYSFYLLHAPLSRIGFALARTWVSSPLASEVAGLVLSFAVCAACSIALHRWVELPSQRWSRRIELTPVAPRAAAA